MIAGGPDSSYLLGYLALCLVGIALQVVGVIGVVSMAWAEEDEDKRREFAREKKMVELSNGFAAFAREINVDPLEFVKRPGVNAYLNRTGAQTVDDVIECGLAEEFFTIFESDLAGIPRQKAMAFLGVAVPSGGVLPSSTVESAAEQQADNAGVNRA